MKTDAPLPGSRESYHKSKLKSKKKLSNEARLLFSDDQTANAVSDRIRHAAKICQRRDQAHDAMGYGQGNDGQTLSIGVSRRFSFGRNVPGTSALSNDPPAPSADHYSHTDLLDSVDLLLVMFTIPVRLHGLSLKNQGRSDAFCLEIDRDVYPVGNCYELNAAT